MQVPTPVAGLALGVVSTGKLLAIYSYEQPVTFVLSVMLLALVISKFLAATELLLKELKDPLQGSIMPTICMTMMLISSELPDGLSLGASVLWYFAVAMHLTLLAGFLLFQSRSFNLSNLLPSWFVPPVGLAVAAAHFSKYTKYAARPKPLVLCDSNVFYLAALDVV